MMPGFSYFLQTDSQSLIWWRLVLSFLSLPPPEAHCSLSRFSPWCGTRPPSPLPARAGPVQHQLPDWMQLSSQAAQHPLRHWRGLAVDSDEFVRLPVAALLPLTSRPSTPGILQAAALQSLDSQASSHCLITVNILAQRARSPSGCSSAVL